MFQTHTKIRKYYDIYQVINKKPVLIAKRVPASLKNQVLSECKKSFAR